MVRVGDVTQGNPSSPMILNIMVDTLLRAVLAEVCRPQEAHHGLGWEVGGKNLKFYAYDGLIMGREPYWVHKVLAVMVEMFGRIVLETKLEKTKAMVFTPGFIWGQIGKEAYKWRVTGGGDIRRGNGLGRVVQSAGQQWQIHHSGTIWSDHTG